jgi:hypothetical protein
MLILKCLLLVQPILDFWILTNIYMALRGSLCSALYMFATALLKAQGVRVGIMGNVRGHLCLLAILCCLFVFFPHFFGGFAFSLSFSLPDPNTHSVTNISYPWRVPHWLFILVIIVITVFLGGHMESFSEFSYFCLCEFYVWFSFGVLSGFVFI